MGRNPILRGIPYKMTAEDVTIRLPLGAAGAANPSEIFGKPLTYTPMKDGSIHLKVKAHEPTSCSAPWHENTRNVRANRPGSFPRGSKAVHYNA